jgi:ubiquinone/menaquinone biosynthesis C-methylase UbiE
MNVTLLTITTIIITHNARLIHSSFYVPMIISHVRNHSASAFGIGSKINRNKRLLHMLDDRLFGEGNDSNLENDSRNKIGTHPKAEGTADEYWYNKNIHTLGNTGFFGALHAALAPLSTKIIDKQAYGGADVRSLVAQELQKEVRKSGARVLDMCCGVGMSTRALYVTFIDADAVVGVDTSPEMVEMAKFMKRHDSDLGKVLNNCEMQKQSQSDRIRRLMNAYKITNRSAVNFVCGNAESTSFPDESFDLVTIMYALHEAPESGRDKLLLEAHRLLRHGGTLAIIDISPDYTPNWSMLSGEPYVLEYQKNIQKQLKKVDGFTNFRHKSVVPGHVEMWILTRDKKYLP